MEGKMPYRRTSPEPKLHVGLTIPHGPSVVEEIMSLVNDPGTSVAKLSAVLMQEPALMRNILRKANTPVFGFKQRVRSVDLAIVLLGFDVLKRTVSSVLIHGALRKMVDALFRYEEYWNHSVACAIISRYLAEKSKKADPDTAFVAGLFHDIGHMMLKQPASFAAAAGATRSASPLPHEELAARVVEKWQFPAGIVDAIRFHHDPMAAKEEPVLAAIVHVADVLCHTTSIARFNVESVPVWSTRALELLGLESEDVRIERITAYCGSMDLPLAETQDFARLVRELKQSLLEGMSNLPDDQKVVMALSYYEGLTSTEISKVVSKDEGLVSRLHADAMETLKKLMLNRA